MPSCDVVPDSIDLGTDRSNLHPITVVGDRFEPIQMPSNVGCVRGQHRASHMGVM